MRLSKIHFIVIGTVVIGVGVFLFFRSRRSITTTMPPTIANTHPITVAPVSSLTKGILAMVS